jgi:hypothetical protein
MLLICDAGRQGSCGHWWRVAKHQEFNSELSALKITTDNWSEAIAQAAARVSMPLDC